MGDVIVSRCVWYSRCWCNAADSTILQNYIRLLGALLLALPKSGFVLRRHRFDKIPLGLLLPSFSSSLPKGRFLVVFSLVVWPLYIVELFFAEKIVREQSTERGKKIVFRVFENLRKNVFSSSTVLCLVTLYISRRSLLHISTHTYFIERGKNNDDLLRRRRRRRRRSFFSLSLSLFFSLFLFVCLGKQIKRIQFSDHHRFNIYDTMIEFW